MRVVLYGRETWSLTLREEEVLRKLSKPKSYEVTGGWRKWHNEELHDLYSRRMRWVGHVARLGEKRTAYRLLIIPKGMRPLGRPRRGWVCNIKMALVEIGLSVVDWIGLLRIGASGELL
jgi:hypothetical protein